jgi:hypothetical protein
MANGLAAPAKKPPANPENLTVNSAGRVEELIGECVCSSAKVYPHENGRCRGVAIKRRIRKEQRRKQQADQVSFQTYSSNAGNDLILQPTLTEYNCLRLWQ